MKEQEAAGSERFAKVVSEAEAEIDDLTELPALEDVMPASDLLRQADLLDALRPRSLRDLAASASPGAEDRSSLAVLRSKAYSAAMGVAKPLRDELERILDYVDAVAVAYRMAAERITELEADLARMREDSGLEE